MHVNAQVSGVSFRLISAGTVVTSSDSVYSMSSEQLSFASTIDALREHVPKSLLHPTIGIVCGSGLSTLASSLREKVLISYDNLPGFARSTGKFFF